MGSTIPSFTTPAVAVGPLSQLQINGYKFTVEETVPITSLGWYKKSGAFTNLPPSHLYLWQMTSAFGGTVVRSAVPTDGASDQWHDVALVSPYECVPGTTYMVTGCHPTTSGYAVEDWANIATADYPFIVSPLTGYYTEGSCIAPPSNAGSGTVLVRASAGDLPPDPDQGVTNFSLETAFLRWLGSGDSNQRQTGLPWLTHALATAIDEAVGDTKDMVEALVAIGIGAKLGDAQAALDGLEAFLYSIAPDNLKQYLDGLEGNIRGAGNPTIADVMTAVGGVSGGGGGLHPMTVGGADWTAGAQEVGNGSWQWVQPADAYVFHTESMVESARFVQAVGPGVAHWFRGWAKPWDGANYYPARHEIVGLDTIIMDGRRWPGIALWVPPDVEWTLTAYDYTPS